MIIHCHCWSMINYISGLLVQYQSFPTGAIIFANMEDCVDYCEQNNYNNDILGRLNISIHNDMTIVWNGTTVILRIINFILHNVQMPSVRPALGQIEIKFSWVRHHVVCSHRCLDWQFESVGAPHQIMVGKHWTVGLTAGGKSSSNLDWNVKLISDECLG